VDRGAALMKQSGWLALPADVAKEVLQQQGVTP
jgi:hypothetical protein